MIEVITINTQEAFRKLALVVDLVEQKLLQFLPRNRPVQKVIFSTSIFLIALFLLLFVFRIVKFSIRLEALCSTIIYRSL
jgi:hypothetical protein